MTTTYPKRYIINIDLEEMFPEEEPNEATACLYQCTDGWLLRFSTEGEGGDAVYTVDPEFQDDELVAVARQGRRGFAVEVVQKKRFKKQDIASVLKEVVPAPPPEDLSEPEVQTGTEEHVEPDYGPWPKDDPRPSWREELTQCWNEYCAERRKQAEKAVDAVIRMFQ